MNKKQIWSEMGTISMCYFFLEGGNRSLSVNDGFFEEMLKNIAVAGTGIQ